MQTNEIVGQVLQGVRLPEMDRALDASRATPETRAKRLSADELRRRGERQPTSMPHRYGAGF